MHKSLKKILLIINLVILISALTSCKSGSIQDPLLKEDVKNEPKKLVLWSLWLNRADQALSPLKKAIQEWNEKNPEILVVEASWNGEQYKSKIKTALAAGDAPDLFYMWRGSFAEPYIDGENILPIDSYLDKKTLDRLYPGVIDSCMYKGKIYSLPIYRYMANLYCNTDLFEKAGVKIPNTFDELMEAVKKLRSKDIVPIVVGEKDRWPGMYWYDILAMRQAGSTACKNALADPPMFDQQVFKEAADKLLRLVDNKAFNEDALNTSFDDMVNEFIKGRAAMMYQGNWVGYNIEDYNSMVNGNIIAIPFPTIKNGKGAITEVYGGITDGYYINVNTEFKQDAVDVLAYLSESTAKEGYLRGGGLSCWRTGNNAKSQLSPLTKQTIEIMESGTSSISWWDTILTATDAEIHKDLVAELFDRRLSSEEFVKRMAKLKGKY